MPGKGTRLIAVASVILVVEAVLHTLGSLAPPPDDPAIRAVWQSMADLTLPLGLGMAPSVLDIQRSLALAMTVQLLLMAAAGLILPAAARGDRRVIRATGGLLAVASAALLALWIFFRVSPPIPFQVATTVLLLLATFSRRPAAA